MNNIKYYEKLSEYIKKNHKNLAKLDVQTFLTDTKFYIQNYALYEHYSCPTFARTYINYDKASDSFNLYNMLEGDLSTNARFDYISSKSADSLSELIKLASNGKIDVNLNELEKLIKSQANLKGNKINSISLSYDNGYTLRICDKKSINIKATKNAGEYNEKDLAEFLTNVQTKIVKMVKREQVLKNIEERSL